MGSKDLGHLPSEVIQKILKHLVERFFSTIHVEYQLISRQWYLASKEVVYKAVTLDESIEEYENFSKLESFLQLLQNSTHNMGQYVKEISLSTESLVIWGALLKYCPNIEEISFQPQSDSCKALWDYLLTAQENSEEKLWKRMQLVSCFESRNTFYRCLQIFGDSLRRLDLDKVPDISNLQDDESEGSEQDLYNYVGGFKRLEELWLDEGLIRHIFGCSVLARCSLGNLVKLIVRLWDEEAPTPTATQAQDTLTDDSYPNLKTLMVSDYVPRHLYKEMMYIKKKFVNLERLGLFSNDVGLMHLIPTQQEADEIMHYLCNIKEFKASIKCLVNLDIVKKFFNVYCKYNKKINLTIHIKDNGYSQGVCMNSKSDVVLYFLATEREDSVSAQELKDILTYIGPQIHTLKYTNENITSRDPVVTRHLFDDLMSVIIQACPQVKELFINGFPLHQRQDADEPNTSIQSIKFGEFNNFGVDYFKYLSVKLPDLNAMAFSIKTNDITYVFMPSTSFKTLFLTWERGRSSWDEPLEGTLVLFITIKNHEGIVVNQCCYKYYVDSEDCPTMSILQEEQEIEEASELKRMKEAPQESHDEKTVSLLNSYTFVDIQCASIDKLRLTRSDGYEDAYSFHPNHVDSAHT